VSVGDLAQLAAIALSFALFGWAVRAAMPRRR
jgi:hypothetical protein